MEKKIYYNLAIVGTITAIVTSIVLVVLFYDFYNQNNFIDDLDINIYTSDFIPKVEDSTSYYDIKLDNNSTLRISRSNYNLFYIFLTILPAIAGILVFLLIGLYLFSSLLTRKIIKPIQITSQNIESILSGKKIKESEIEIYEELKPFLNTINAQKREIQHYIKSLERGEKIRREFTANVSHELKTPLTSINGFAELIESGTMEDEAIIKSASIIRKEGSRLLELIDSIIKLSHLEDTSLSKEFKSIDLLQIAKSIYSNLLPRAEESNISLNISGENINIKGNERMIEDLIYNLVDNAIKYNKNKGKVEIRVSSDDSFGIIKVSDTGIGISPEDQNRVFERFYRVDKSRSKKIGGTGLGLSLVKHTVEYHNGNLSISSVEGEGTAIEVKLPIN